MIGAFTIFHGWWGDDTWLPVARYAGWGAAWFARVHVDSAAELHFICMLARPVICDPCGDGSVGGVGAERKSSGAPLAERRPVATRRALGCSVAGAPDQVSPLFCLRRMLFTDVLYRSSCPFWAGFWPSSRPALIVDTCGQLAGRPSGTVFEQYILTLVLLFWVMDARFCPRTHREGLGGCACLRLRVAFACVLQLCWCRSHLGSRA